jgi:hypothetical protein
MIETSPYAIRVSALAACSHFSKPPHPDLHRMADLLADLARQRERAALRQVAEGQTL